MKRIFLTFTKTTMVLGLVLASTNAFADATILVPGSKETREACNAAAAKMNATCARHLTKAMNAAAEELAKGGPMKVTIKIAAGEHKGDMDAGNYLMPLFNNPQADLVFEGGYDASFSKRDPFFEPTYFVTTSARGGPFLVVKQKTMTKSLTFDGIVWDMVASNGYDAKTNSLIKSRSKTDKFIKFNYWELQDLVFKNNVFMNSPHVVTESLIRAANNNATITYANNIFFNNVIPIKLASARYRNTVKLINVVNNSFILNWSMNPDPTTGMPGALNVGSKDDAQEIVIANNLFYGNFGGGIQLAPDNAPKLSIKNNNFVGNGLLHGKTASEAVPVISARQNGLQPLDDLETIEDITDMTKGDGTGNVSINPGLGVALATTKTANSGDVQALNNWQNAVKHILGQNLDGGRVDIKDYAPKQNYNPKALFPSVANAKAYGASPSLK